MFEDLPDDELKAIGLTNEQFTDTLERRLRAARLFYDRGPLWFLLPTLYVNVSVVGPAFNVLVLFNKEVTDPISGEDGAATTWYGGATGTHGGNGQFVLEGVDGQPDKFLLEYLRVNEEAC